MNLLLSSYDQFVDSNKTALQIKPNKTLIGKIGNEKYGVFQEQLTVLRRRYYGSCDNLSAMGKQVGGVHGESRTVLPI